MGRDFGSKCLLLTGTNVLRMLHLHEEEFQVHAGHAFIRRDEVLPEIWPPGYMTILRVADVVIARIHALVHADSEPRVELLLLDLG